jgi:hypothetical protein
MAISQDERERLKDEPRPTDDDVYGANGVAFEGWETRDIRLEARRARCAEADLREYLARALENLEHHWQDRQPRSYAEDFLAEGHALLRVTDAEYTTP